MLLATVNIAQVLLRILIIYILVILRYLLFAGMAYLVFYSWKRARFLRFKIQDKFPERSRMNAEVRNSFITMAIFACVGGIIFMLRNYFGLTKIYYHFGDHSAWYFIFSVLLFIVAHDTYFYFTHRFMHWKKIYPYVHKVHHHSTNPSPWAAFAFHPLEAVIEVGILPIMVFLIPLHPFAILAWVLYMTFMNVLGHLGFELYPSGFTKGFFSKWHNTSTHHNMHHRYVQGNYGLYFNFWDRMLGTNHVRYEQEFEAVKTKAVQS